MFQVLTIEELRRKGITRRQVAAMMRRAERLCAWHLRRHMERGSTAAEVAAWDIACAKWDNLKATLQVFEAKND